MEEIGEQLKIAREKMGVSVEEVAEDLKIKPTQIENIEAGNREAFEDVFYLKHFIRDYAKYLGLDKDDMVDEFNEYLFDLTSRLSLDDIKQAKKDNVKTSNVQSPYTMEQKKKMSFIPFLIYTVIIVLLVTIIYFVVNITNNSQPGEGAIVVENE